MGGGVSGFVGGGSGKVGWRAYTGPLRVELGLVVIVVELWGCEGDLGEFSGAAGEDGGEVLGAGAADGPEVDDVDLVAFL